MPHRLSPLFNAQSVAVVGASAKPDSFGERMAKAALSRGYSGDLSFINPRGGTILDREVLTSVRELDHAPDMAILGVGRRNLEGALIDAIDAGAKSAVIFDTCQGQSADGETLLSRLKSIAREANIPICGGSGMGLINMQNGLVGSFYPVDQMKAGGISLIAHSGSVFTVLGMNDPRFRFDLLSSPGQEIGATVDEYISFATERETTHTIAVFMESARNPEGLIKCLLQARDAGKPVVICKVGRTEESARLARSHTGALAGSHEAYAAVFRECGAISVNSVDALMNTALLCSMGRVPDAGRPGLITDSGGLREMTLDLAEENGTRLAELSSSTRDSLRAVLPPELEPSNPLDCAADFTDEFYVPFEHGLDHFARADEVSMLGFEIDLRDDYVYDEKLWSLMRTLTQRTDKPVFAYASFGRAHNRRLGDELADLGVPYLNGAETMLQAIQHFQDWADARGMAVPDRPKVPKFTLPHGVLDESVSLGILEYFGLDVAKNGVCNLDSEVRAMAEELGFPLVLKTAEPGVEHKSDVDGVFLDINDEKNLLQRYKNLTTQLGPRVTLQRQIESGIELAFGCVVDPEFGPLVMVSPGGRLVELFDERCFARAPFSDDVALSLIRKLRVAQLIDGVRGESPRDMTSAATALSAFSVACAALADQISEMDVNPVMVTHSGATAVDALIIRKPD
ncbi:MAG: acetate--CoA ligase family protein [Pseudomonadota bacterium]